MRNPPPVTCIEILLWSPEYNFTYTLYYYEHDYKLQFFNLLRNVENFAEKLCYLTLTIVAQRHFKRRGFVCLKFNSYYYAIQTYSSL